MVSDRRQLEGKVIPAEEYRRLVLTHVYLLCKSRRIPLTGLGKDELAGAGARIAKNEWGVRCLEVDIPPEGERALRADLLRISINDNREFLPEPSKKRGKGGFVRGRKRLSDAQPMDEGLMDSTGSSAMPKDRF
jgi:hypothetical protein